MRVFAGQLLLIFSIVLSACSTDELEPLNQDDVIVAFGDSLTAGYGVSKENAYPAKLAQIIDTEVVNAGVSGETTQQGLQRIDSVLRKHTPALVILFEGGNDILRNQDLSKTKANLNQMIEKIKDSGAQPVLVGLPRKSLLSSTAELYEELADQHDIPLQANIVAKLLRQPSMKSDSVHFNANGYYALAEAIAELLRESGAVNQ